MVLELGSEGSASKGHELPGPPNGPLMEPFMVLNSGYLGHNRGYLGGGRGACFIP